MTSFSKSSTKRSGGRSYRCKACDSDYHREYRKRNAQQLKRKRAEKYDPVLNSQQCKEYREKNKERVQANKAEYHQRNAEKIKAKVAEWVRDNRDRRRVVASRYSARRRALIEQLGADIDAESVTQMHDDQGGLCAYCEADIKDEYQIEHMMPLSRGGANDWTNIALACAPCNARKGSKTVEEFMGVLRAAT